VESGEDKGMRKKTRGMENYGDKSRGIRSRDQRLFGHRRGKYQQNKARVAGQNPLEGGIRRGQGMREKTR